MKTSEDRSPLIYGNKSLTVLYSVMKYYCKYIIRIFLVYYILLKKRHLQKTVKLSYWGKKTKMYLLSILQYIYIFLCLIKISVHLVY